MHWPASLEYFYFLHRYLGNALQAILPLDCFYTNAYYISIVAAALAPFAIIVFFSITWGILLIIFKAIRYSAPTLRVTFVNIIPVSLAYAYPCIVRVALSAFLCETIEPGEQWVRANLSVRCWDQRHLKYTLAASLPTLLLWGVGLPAFASLYMVKKRLINGEYAVFLWKGFKNQFSLCEMSLVFCKFLIAAVYIFSAKLTPTAQALLLLVVLSLLLLLQRIYHPYTEAVCNRVALLSFGVVWTTAYAGLFFSSTDSSLLLVVLVCCLQAWFILVWILAVCGSKLHWVMCLRPKTSRQ